MKVLFLRFSSIGDIVLCTPVIRAVKQQLGAEVHFLTKKSYESVLAENPYIDELISFQDDVAEVKEKLIGSKYDFIVDLHNNLRSAKVKTWLKVDNASFPKFNVQKWLLVNTKINRLPDLHIVDRYFMATRNLGLVQNDGKGLDYFIGDRDKVDLTTAFDGKLHKQKFACLVLGATYFTKRIPETLAVELISKSTVPVVLIGGPEEKEIGEELAKAKENVINTCGSYNLNQSASLVEQSDLVITGDTGVMHIAAAFKKKIIMIWGNTVADFGMGPYETEAYHFKVSGLSCRPCSKLGYHTCPKGHFKCMKAQDTEGIVGKMMELIK